MKIRAFIITLVTTLSFVSCTDSEMELCGGVYTGGVENDKPSGYGTWTKDSVCYQGFWKNGARNGQGTLTKGRYKYRGSFKDGLFDGIGVLTYGDSILYHGSWKEGKRHGEGVVRDSMNREICAIWENDTARWGVRTDATGIYKGEIDQHFIPNGKGIFRYGSMQFYSGSWLNDEPHGFGIQLAPDGWFRVGTWKKGNFKGEILNYTADRIYGIDIARYQHKAPIAWKYLKIRDLGRSYKKRITGTVDYPISFMFIKCTEGETILNNYYADDYSKARSHGIRCGSYHFFSMHSSPQNQAYNFLKHLKLNKGDLPPVLDVEPSDRAIASIGGDKELFRRVRIWLDIVEEHTGMVPILYINQMFVNKHLPSAPDIKKKYPVWIARYGQYKPDLKLDFWQLSADGYVRGIRGTVDINVFNGYRPAYDRYLKENTYKGKPSGANR